MEHCNFGALVLDFVEQIYDVRGRELHPPVGGMALALEHGFRVSAAAHVFVMVTRIGRPRSARERLAELSVVTQRFCECADAQRELYGLRAGGCVRCGISQNSQPLRCSLQSASGAPAAADLLLSRPQLRQPPLRRS